MEDRIHEAGAIYRSSDHGNSERALGRQEDRASIPRAWVNEATLYGWKSKYGRIEVGEAQQLRSLEDENRRLNSWASTKNAWSLPV